jgi:hypothetical protein
MGRRYAGVYSLHDGRRDWAAVMEGIANADIG